MIGGTDVVVEIADDLRSGEIFDTVVRCVYNKWPNAIVQNASNGDCFSSFSEIAFGQLREIFVHRDSTTFKDWQDAGVSRTNADTMMHFIADKSTLTIVVDDPSNTIVKSIISEIQCYTLPPQGLQ